MTALATTPLTPEKLSPLERLEALFDRGTLRLHRTAVIAPGLGERARPGDGVLAGTGRVAGRPVAAYAQDVSLLGGSLGARQAQSIVEILQLAGRARIPVVGFIESGGARLQEGLAALDGYGAIFREHVRLSGRVPQISVIGGTSAGGGCYGPALTDFVVMTGDSAMFLTGPAVVEEVTGEQVSIDELGGPEVHARNGVSHLVADTDADAARCARELLGYLPDRAGDPPPGRVPEPAGSDEPGRAVPAEPRRVYDVRHVAGALADRGRLLELQPGWARNIFTGFARIDGRSVAIIANQPRYLGGVLDSEAAQKGARFVRCANMFGLPLLVLVDTPGFLPGTRQERGAVIRHGAKLVHAFAEATVPSVTVVLRKAFGGAYIAMNSKALGADLSLAWPSAEMGVMGGTQAVTIVNRRELAAAEDRPALRTALADRYSAEQLHTGVAAGAGHVDEVISPGQTRDRVAEALTMLAEVRPSDSSTSGGNVPL